MVTDFKTFWNAGLPNRRTQKPSTGANRLHQNMVPEMHRADATLNHKVEQLRLSPPGRKLVINQADYQYITQKYNLQNLDRETPKFLGKTGIKLSYDNALGQFILTK